MRAAARTPSAVSAGHFLPVRTLRLGDPGGTPGGAAARPVLRPLPAGTQRLRVRSGRPALLSRPRRDSSDDQPGVNASAAGQVPGGGEQAGREGDLQGVAEQEREETGAAAALRLLA
ncbi:hypothetical protein GCM10025331_75520 [Actinoplanes utahensis]|nr:hypothetical protein Aut01nite_67310 [Actinoplanes utahensis]